MRKVTMEMYQAALNAFYANIMRVPGIVGCCLRICLVYTTAGTFYHINTKIKTHKDMEFVVSLPDKQPIALSFRGCFFWSIRERFVVVESIP
jgi:hypothetical protein